MRECVTSQVHEDYSRGTVYSNSIDFLKGISCIAVVLIHFNLSGDYGMVVKTLGRFAVPFFFFVSGYFIFDRQMELNSENLKRKLKRTTVLLLKAGLFYLIFCLVYNYLFTKNWNPLVYAGERLTKARIIRFFVTTDPFVYSHLWFLMAQIECYLFFFVLAKLSVRNMNSVYLFLTSAALLVTYTVMVEFHAQIIVPSSLAIPGTDDQRIYLFNTFPVRALSLVLLGMFCRKISRLFNQSDVTKIQLLIMLLLGSVLAIRERFIFKDAQMFIGTYLVLFAFILFLHTYDVPEKNPLVFLGRNLSGNVYIFHIAVGYTIRKLMQLTHLYSKTNAGLLVYDMLVVVASVALSFLIYRFDKKESS